MTTENPYSLLDENASNEKAPSFAGYIQTTLQNQKNYLSSRVSWHHAYKYLTSQSVQRDLFGCSTSFPALVYFRMTLLDNGDSNWYSQDSYIMWCALCSFSVNFASFFILGQEVFDLFQKQLAQASQKNPGNKQKSLWNFAKKSGIEEAVKLVILGLSSSFLTAQSNQVPDFRNWICLFLAAWANLTNKPGMDLLIRIIKDFFKTHIVMSEAAIERRDTTLLKHAVNEALSHSFADMHDALQKNELKKGFNPSALLERINSAQNNLEKEQAKKEALLSCFQQLESSSRRRDKLVSSVFSIAWTLAIVNSLGYDRATYESETFGLFERFLGIVLDVFLISIMASFLSNNFAYLNMKTLFMKTEYNVVSWSLAFLAYFISGFSFHPSWLDNKVIYQSPFFKAVTIIGAMVFNGSFMHGLLKDKLMEPLLNFIYPDQSKKITDLIKLQEQLKPFLEAMGKDQTSQLIAETLEQPYDFAHFSIKMIKALRWPQTPADCLTSSGDYKPTTHPHYTTQREALELQSSICSALPIAVTSILVLFEAMTFDNSEALLYTLLGLSVAAALSHAAYQQPALQGRKPAIVQARIIAYWSLLAPASSYEIKLLTKAMCEVTLKMGEQKTFLSVGSIGSAAATSLTFFAVKRGCESLRDEPTHEVTLCNDFT